jgi:hypothetical protein
VEFVAYLFRRGRVDLGDHPAAGRHFQRHTAHNSHVLVRAEGGYSLVRRFFDCGFD